MILAERRYCEVRGMLQVQLTDLVAYLAMEEQWADRCSCGWSTMERHGCRSLDGDQLPCSHQAEAPVQIVMLTRSQKQESVLDEDTSLSAAEDLSRLNIHL